jgi:hypothetical protein
VDNYLSCKCMTVPDSSTAFNASLALFRCRLLPVATHVNNFPLTCIHCRFVNQATNNFCTHCGYPVYPNQDRLAIFNLRVTQKKNLQRSALAKVSSARNALYVLAACCMLGVFYLFSDWKEIVVRGFVMVILGVIYTGLARWSLVKPVTALLIGLILMLTFAAIYIWAEVTSFFRLSTGIYLLIIQIILIYFLFEGVKAAFQADILDEEFKT